MKMGPFRGGNRRESKERLFTGFDVRLRNGRDGRMHAVDGRPGAQIESADRGTQAERRILVGSPGFKDPGTMRWTSQK